MKELIEYAGRSVRAPTNSSSGKWSAGLANQTNVLNQRLRELIEFAQIGRWVLQANATN